MKKIVEFPTLAENANNCPIQAVVAMHIDLEINFECHAGKVQRAYAEL